MDHVKTIVLVTNIPNPYRIPLFNELSEQLARRRIKLKVLFGALGYSRRQWKINLSDCKFDYEVLSSKQLSLSDPEKISFTYKGILGIVNRERPEVIVTNGFSFATMKLWLRSHFRNTPYIIWTGSIPRWHGAESYFRKLQRKMLIKKAKGFVTYGSRTKEYLMSFGVEASNIQIAINTVDISFYSSETKKIKENLKQSNDCKHLLSIGELVPRKDVLTVLEIIKNLSKIRSDFVLDIVGDGVEREKLETFVKDNCLTKLVKFHGYQQRNDIPSYFAKSSCLLFHTNFDIWGLVLVEAMSAGVPCLASVNAGATYDLIQDHKTGFSMDFKDTESVINRINWVLDNPSEARTIGLNAREYILENVSLQKSAGGFVAAIDAFQQNRG